MNRTRTHNTNNLLRFAFKNIHYFIPCFQNSSLISFVDGYKPWMVCGLLILQNFSTFTFFDNFRHKILIHNYKYFIYKSLYFFLFIIIIFKCLKIVFLKKVIPIQKPHKSKVDYIFIMSSNRLLLEYIWLDADQGCRSKTKIINIKKTSILRLSLNDIPTWNYDGSSTGQATTTASEVVLVPVKFVHDPFARPLITAPLSAVLSFANAINPMAPHRLKLTPERRPRNFCHGNRSQRPHVWFGARILHFAQKLW